MLKKKYIIELYMVESKTNDGLGKQAEFGVKAEFRRKPQKS